MSLLKKILAGSLSQKYLITRSISHGAPSKSIFKNILWKTLPFYHQFNLQMIKLRLQTANTNPSSRETMMMLATMECLLVVLCCFSALSPVLSQWTPPKYDWDWLGNSRWPFPLNTPGLLAVASMEPQPPIWQVWPGAAAAEAHWVMHGEQMTVSEGTEMVGKHHSPLWQWFHCLLGKIPWLSAPSGTRHSVLSRTARTFFKIAIFPPYLSFLDAGNFLGFSLHQDKVFTSYHIFSGHIRYHQLLP